MGALAIVALSLLLTVTIILSPFALVLLLVAAVGVAMGFAALASEIGTRLPVLQRQPEDPGRGARPGDPRAPDVQPHPGAEAPGPGTATCVALGATIRTRFGTRPREFPEAV